MNIHKEFVYFVKDIWERRFLILQLAQREIKTTYTGSLLGPVWVVLEPLSFLIMLWIFFGLGMRSGQVKDAPFLVYLASGMACWFFFAQTFNTSTELIKRYAFLLKKIDFRLGILPFVNILATSVSHGVFLLVVLGIAFLHGVRPSFFYLQLLYYYAAMCFFLLGLGWLTSALNIFIRDVGKMVGIIVQFGFWLTPIFWDIDIVPPKYQYMFKLNPMYYVVAGYRDSIIYRTPFWDKPFWTLYTWAFIIVTILGGAIIFKKLRPHFSQVI